MLPQDVLYNLYARDLTVQAIPVGIVFGVDGYIRKVRLMLMRGVIHIKASKNDESAEIMGITANNRVAISQLDFLQLFTDGKVSVLFLSDMQILGFIDVPLQINNVSVPSINFMQSYACYKRPCYKYDLPLFTYDELLKYVESTVEWFDTLIKPSSIDIGEFTITEKEISVFAQNHAQKPCFLRVYSDMSYKFIKAQSVKSWVNTHALKRKANSSLTLSNFTNLSRDEVKYRLPPAKTIQTLSRTCFLLNMQGGLKLYKKDLGYAFELEKQNTSLLNLYNVPIKRVGIQYSEIQSLNTSAIIFSSGKGTTIGVLNLMDGVQYVNTYGLNLGSVKFNCFTSLWTLYIIDLVLDSYKDTKVDQLENKAIAFPVLLNVNSLVINDITRLIFVRLLLALRTTHIQFMSGNNVTVQLVDTYNDFYCSETIGEVDLGVGTQKEHIQINLERLSLSVRHICFLLRGTISEDFRWSDKKQTDVQIQGNYYIKLMDLADTVGLGKVINIKAPQSTIGRLCINGSYCALYSEKVLARCADKVQIINIYTPVATFDLEVTCGYHEYYKHIYFYGGVSAFNLDYLSAYDTDVWLENNLDYLVGAGELGIKYYPYLHTTKEDKIKLLASLDKMRLYGFKSDIIHALSQVLKADHIIDDIK